MTSDEPSTSPSPDPPTPPPPSEWRQSTAWRVVRAIARFPLTRLLLVLFLTFLLMIPAALLFVGVGMALGVSGRAPAGSDEGILGATFITGSTYAVMVACMILARHLVERFVMKRPHLEEYALRPAARETGAGYLLGFGLVGLVVLTMLACGWYSPAASGFAGGGKFAYSIFLATVLFLMVAIFEEVLFRGVIFVYAEDLLGTIPALILSGAVFGFVHADNPGASLRSSLCIAVTAGPMLGLLLVASRRMWLPIGMHWAWNFTLGPVFGLPVSGFDFAARREAMVIPSVTGPAEWTGGAFGPEAGYPLLIFGTILTAALAVIAWRRGQIHLVPAWVRELRGRRD